MGSQSFPHQQILVKAQPLEGIEVKSESREELLLAIEQLRQELQDIKGKKAELEISLEAARDRADTVEVLLRKSNQQLQAEIAEKLRLQAELKAAQTELQSVLANLNSDKADLEMILETTMAHGDIVEDLLHNQCIRDPLTGLFNRRYLHNFLSKEIDSCSRQKQPLSIIMLDIDHFKRCNDTFGHDAGDAVLEEISLFLQRQMQNSEIVCRYGGEEFMVVLPEGSLVDAYQRAEEIRQGVKELAIEYQDMSLDRITISLGVASFPEHGKTVAEVIRAADVALYHAKAKGRDRVARPEAIY
ncbi:diguanylate kinase [Oscillatoriales cyanobacterium USR001]|nr:diguanylate kinase [Oscillatoriales cyanobacterium USR001]